jgi:translation initiation factor IF-2
LEIHFKGATTDFIQKIDSMQYDHQPISAAKKGQEVGIKVNEKVREGDEVLEVV